MTPNYTYINSPDYIDSFSFDYIETYSFQRGDEYVQNLYRLKIEYANLTDRKTQGNGLTNDEEKNYQELSRLVGPQYLIDELGRFHPSCKKVATLQHDNPAIKRIKQNDVTVFFYFNNLKPDVRTFESTEDYKKQRDRFLEEYTKHLTTCSDN